MKHIPQATDFGFGPVTCFGPWNGSGREPRSGRSMRCTCVVWSCPHGAPTSASAARPQEWHHPVLGSWQGGDSQSQAQPCHSGLAHSPHGRRTKLHPASHCGRTLGDSQPGRCGCLMENSKREYLRAACFKGPTMGCGWRGLSGFPCQGRDPPALGN